jgi:uncharacterized protein YecT (DUF1311 family)
MPARTRILPALLLLCCSPLAARAQFTGPKPPPPTQTPKLQPPAPPSNPALEQIPASSYADPCELNAMKVDFDTCYAEQLRMTDQDLSRFYRAALLSFEQDIADAHKRSDSNQIGYDATALADLKATQAEWTKYRDLQCAAAGQQFQGGSIQPIVVNKCMIFVTRHRIDEIRAAYEIGGRKLD